MSAARDCELTVVRGEPTEEEVLAALVAVRVLRGRADVAAGGGRAGPDAASWTPRERYRAPGSWTAGGDSPLARPDAVA